MPIFVSKSLQMTPAAFDRWRPQECQISHEGRFRGRHPKGEWEEEEPLRHPQDLRLPLKTILTISVNLWSNPLQNLRGLRVPSPW